MGTPSSAVGLRIGPGEQGVPRSDGERREAVRSNQGFEAEDRVGGFREFAE